MFTVQGTCNFFSLNTAGFHLKNSIGEGGVGVSLTRWGYTLAVSVLHALLFDKDDALHIDHKMHPVKAAVEA